MNTRSASLASAIAFSGALIHLGPTECDQTKCDQKDPGHSVQPECREMRGNLGQWRGDRQLSPWKKSWILRASALLMPPTASRPARLAGATPRAEPKCASNLRLRPAPTPPISSS